MSKPCRRADPRLACVLLAMLAGIAAATTVFAQSTPQDYLRQMDSDGDGRVSRSEYIAHMSRSFERIDADGNGVLEGDELPPGARRVTRASSEASLAEAFARQDTNHDGYLDARELARPPR